MNADRTDRPPHEQWVCTWWLGDGGHGQSSTWVAGSADDAKGKARGWVMQIRELDGPPRDATVRVQREVRSVGPDGSGGWQTGRWSPDGPPLVDWMQEAPLPEGHELWEPDPTS